MEQFRKQLCGFAFILLGIVFSISAITYDAWFPIVDSIPWGELGVLMSIIGVIIVCKNGKDKEDEE